MRLFRLISLLLLLCLLPLVGWAEKLAEPATFDGSLFLTLTDQPGVPRVYVFADLNQAQMSTSALADWYEYPDLNPGQELAHQFNVFDHLEDGHTYLVDMNGQRDTFVVFHYPNYRILNHDLTAELDCDKSILRLDVDAMDYRSLSGTQYIIERECVVRYTNAVRDSVSWKEEEQTNYIKVSRPRTIDLHTKILTQTGFTLVADQFSEYLYDSPDSVVLPSSDVLPVAVDFIPKSYTALRGEKPENENQRVTDQGQLSGSAPLNVLFQANASPLTSVFFWQFMRSTDILSERTENEARYIFDETGKYKVNLTISGPTGCHCDTTFDVDVKESVLAVPNVFTPNGDGVNDEFRVVYRSIDHFSILIYNRWQHLIYSSNDPAKGWDGRINGQKAPDGAYFYIIEATGSDGEKYKFKGAVNLLRGGN